MAKAKKEKKAKVPKTPKEPKARKAKTPKDPAAESKPREKKERADGTMSGCDAAASLLKDSKEPMTTKQIYEEASRVGIWKPEGKTPWATLYSNILREIKTHGDKCRFVKAGPGKFALKAE